jgi:hypothetical protein
MFHPGDPGVSETRAVRDGRLVPVTCATCGCRLEDAGDATWLHFGRLGGRDARGCRVECAELTHDVHGHALVALPA